MHTQAILFHCLREHYQKRDGLWLVLDYGKKHPGLLLRGGEEERNSSTPHPTLSPSEAERAREAKQAEADYERARTQAEQDYEETAAAMTDKKSLTPDEEAELIQNSDG